MSKKPNSSASKKASDESRLVRKMKQHADSSRVVTSSTSPRYLFGRKAHDIQIVSARSDVISTSSKHLASSAKIKKHNIKSATTEVARMDVVKIPPRPKGKKVDMKLAACVKQIIIDIRRRSGQCSPKQRKVAIPAKHVASPKRRK